MFYAFLQSLVATPMRLGFVLLFAFIGFTTLAGIGIAAVFAWGLDRQRDRKAARAARATEHLRGVLRTVKRNGS